MRKPLPLLKMTKLVLLTLIIFSSWGLKEAIAQGNSLSYDGSDDYVKLTGSNTSSTAVKPTTQFTLEAWVKPAITMGPSDQYDIISSGPDGGGMKGYHFIISGGHPMLYVNSYSNTCVAGSITLTSGVWYHLAATYDATTGSKIYLNGKEIASAANNGSVNYDNEFVTIGRLASQAFYHWNGAIDEVRIWNVVRSATEIQNNLRSEFSSPYSANLVAYLKFNEGTSGGNNTGLTNTTDEIGSFDGELVNLAKTGSSSNWVDGYTTTSLSSLSVSASLSSFSACSGTASSSQSFTVSGSNLIENIVITAPTDFEVSTSSGSGYSGNVTLTPSSGSVSNTTIYVRMKSSASGSPSGNVTVVSAVAVTENIAVSGTVNVIPSAPTGSASQSYSGYGTPTISLLSATGSNIQWYAAASGGSALAGSTALVSGTHYYASQTVNGCESSSRLDVTATRAATTWYVKSTATGTGDGSSWTDAIVSLGDALNTAVSGDQIWVAGGTYYPNRDKDYTVVATRFKTFRLKSGVNVYGGFAGTESTLGDRTTSVVAANPSILSGDIGTVGVNTDNCYHVVMAHNVGGISFDGFTISDGYANAGTSASFGPGLVLYDNYGAGLVCMGTTATFNNLIITNNYAATSGGGVYHNSYGLGGSMTFTNCRFTSNTATSWFYGSAYYAENGGNTLTSCYIGSNTGSAVSSFPYGTYTINKCVFENNTGINGGAFFIRKSGANIYNSVFVGNSATNGGAVYVYNENNESSGTLYNCTFYNNSSSTQGKAVHGAQTTAYNCIFQGNTGTGYEFYGPNSSSLYYSIIQAANVYTGITLNSCQSGDARFSNTSDLDGADNTWGTSDDGLTLTCGSSAYNTGTNSYGNSVDIIGTSRPQFTTKDMGAYESTTNLSAPAAPTAGSVTATYDGTLKTGSATTAYTLTWYDAATNGSVTSAPSGTNAGTYTAYAQATDASGNGCSSTSRTAVTVTINAKALTVSGLSATSKTYDGNATAAITGTPSLVGIVGSEDVTLSGTASGVFNNKNFGTSKAVTVSGFSLGGTANLSNYSLTQPTLSADINKKELTVSVSASNKTYNASDVASLSSATLNGVVGSEDVTLGGSVTANFNNKNIGTGKTVTLTGSYSVSGADIANYTLTQPSGLTADITAKTLTVNVAANNKIYDGTNSATLGSASFVGVESGDDVTIDGTVTATFADPNVATGIAVNLSGNYTKTGTDAGNYTITQPSGLTADITKRTLTITANNKNKTYGTAISGGSGSNQFSSSGLQNGETIGSVTIAYGTGAAATDAVGNYSFEVTASSATAGTFDINNYDVHYVNGDIIIGNATLNITANNKAKCFGDTYTFDGTEFSVSGLLNSDDVTSVTLTSAGAGAGATVGSHNIVPSDAVGSGLTNYNINYNNGTYTVRANPTASFNVNDADQCFQGNSFTLTNTSSNGTGTINSWSWSTAGGTHATETGAGPHTTSYSAFGNKTINLTVTDNFGCTNSTSYTNNITVWDMPVASFTINDNTQCLTGNSFTLTNTSTNGSGSINSWVWSTSGATHNSETGAGPHTTAYATSGNKTVNLTVTDANGCSNATAYSNNITVYAMPVPSFTFNDNTQCFVGNSYELTNTSTNGTGNITDWNWTATSSSSASMTGSGPHTITYATHGDYTVNLSVTDEYNCTVTTNYTNNVRVYQHPTASYTVTESSGNTNNDNHICTGATVTFNGTASTYGFGASSLSYQWKKDGSNASGSGNNSSIYSPAIYGVNNPDQFDYWLVVTDNNNCSSSAFTSPTVNTIYIYPFPVPSFTTPAVGTQATMGSASVNGNGGQLLCHSKVVFANTSTIPSGSIVQYTWDYGDASSNDVVTTAQDMKHEFPVNYNINWFDPGFPNTRYTVTLIAKSDEGCSTTVATTKDIKNGPDAVIGLNDPTTQNLAGNSFLFENNSFNRHPSFITNSLWDFGDGDTTTVTTFIPKVYASAGDYRVHLIVYTTTGCSDTANIDLTIVPSATSSFTYAYADACASKVVNFTSTSISAGTYAWNFGDAASGVNNTSTSANPSHTFSANGSYTVTLTVNGSVVSSQTVVVANSVSSVSINAPSISTCSNEYTFTSTVSGGYNVTYSWNFSGGTGGALNASSATRSYGSAGAETADLMVYSNGACGVSATQYAFTSVATLTSPSASVAMNSGDECTDSRTFTSASTNYTDLDIKLDNGSWISNPSMPYTFTGLTNGSHTVYLRASNGGSCADIASVDFGVSSATAAFTGTPASCGTNVSFSSTGSSVASGAITYAWVFEDGGVSTAANPSVTFASSGTKNVTLTVTSSISGCEASSNGTVAVSAVSGPTASFTTAVAAGSCTNGRDFTNTSSGSGNTYSWNFGDGTGSAQTSPSHWYGSAGTYSVTLTVTNGSCTSTASTSVTIGSSSSGPAASFTTAPDDTMTLASNSFNFFNTSTHLNFGWNSSYAWDFGDGTSSTNTHVYSKSFAAAGTYLVTLTATNSNGCNSTFSSYVTVTPSGGGGGGGSGPCAAVAGFNEANNNTTQTLSTNSFIFFNQSVHNGFGWNTNYDWDFGDGTTSTNTHIYGKTYATAGTYTVELTATSSTGCTNSYSMDVIVTSNATAAFSASTNSCSSRAVNFTNTSVSASSYSWNFGDGNTSTSASPSHTYAADGVYTVSLSINGGASTVSHSVTIATNPVVGTVSHSLSSCGNTYTYTVDGSTGTNLTYAWTFGSSNGTGSTSGESVTRTYSADDNESAMVEVTADGRCSSTSSAYNISVLEASSSANAVLTVTASNACNGTRTIDNTGSSAADEFQVSVDGGAYSTVATFPYDITGLSAGSHTVSLKAVLGSCEDIASSTFSVGSVSASFTTTASSCGPTVAFTNTSTATYGTPTYAWNFNSGEGTSTSTSPNFTFSSGGTKTVSLTVTLANGCSTVYTNNSVVATAGSGAVNASFTSSMEINGACNTGVRFNGTGSSNAVQYQWNYGDGTSSYISMTNTIFHAYRSTGTFSVTLTAYDACGNTDTHTASVLVTATGNPTPEVNFTTDNVTQCVTGNRYDFFNRTTINGFGWVPTYKWYFGDGTTDFVNTFSYGKTYASAGTYTVKLVATSNAGCSDSATMDVVVLPSGSCSPTFMRDRLGEKAFGGAGEVKGTKSSTGISKYDVNDKVTLYPNPNNGDFTLGLQDIRSNEINIVIVDMLGREVYSRNYRLEGARQINLFELNLSPGSYNVILKGDDGLDARKPFVVVK